MHDFMKALKSRILTPVSFSANSYPEFTGTEIQQAQAKNEKLFKIIFLYFF